MALTDPHAPGATPLTIEQLKGLRNPFITSHAELNRAEQANIVRARVWAGTARSIGMPKMLSREFLENLHRRMYADVWTWAGKQRTVDTNIGVDFPKIGVEHPFPNGNGRLSRFYADLVLTRHFKQNPLTWGGGQLGNEDPRRQQYIEALRAADNHDYIGLIGFATGQHPL